MSGRLGLRKKKKERGKTGENHDTEAKETAKAWVDSLVGDVDIAPK